MISFMSKVHAYIVDAKEMKENALSAEVLGDANGRVSNERSH